MSDVIDFAEDINRGLPSDILEGDYSDLLAAPAEQEWKRQLQRVGVVSLVIAILIGIWELIVVVFSLPSVELPSPVDVVRSFVDNASFLVQNAGPTVLEGSVGYLLAVVIGVPLGVLLARPSKVALAMNTGVVAAQIFPKIAIAPLFIVWFGFGYMPKFLFVLISAFFPIAMSSAAGFLSTPPEVRELGKIMGFGTRKQLRYLYIPWALPQIFTGLKISASYAVIAAIVYEFVGASHGLGVVILQSESNINIPLMFAAIMLVAALGFLFYGLVAGAEGLAIPWHVSKRRAQH